MALNYQRTWDPHETHKHKSQYLASTSGINCKCIGTPWQVARDLTHVHILVSPRDACQHHRAVKQTFNISNISTFHLQIKNYVEFLQPIVHLVENCRICTLFLMSIFSCDGISHRMFGLTLLHFWLFWLLIASFLFKGPAKR